MNGFFRFLAWCVVLFGAVSAIVYYAYADVWVMPKDDPRMLASVEPTLRGGDIVLVERHGQPVIGNLARCTDPDEPRRFVVGRIVGLDGSQLTIHKQAFSTPGSHPHTDSSCGDVRLQNPATGNEVALTCRYEEFAGTSYQILNRTDDTSSDRELAITVPPGKAFLISDDRYLHDDSREYGSVPVASCKHVVFRLWGGEGFTDGSRRFNLLW